MNENEPSSDAGPEPMRRRSAPRPARWTLALAGIAIAYSPSWLPPLIRAFNMEWILPWGERSPGPPAQILWNTLGVGLLLAFMFGVERRPLASIGIRRPTGKQLEWALYLFGFAMTWQWLVHTFWPQGENAGENTIASQPIVAVVGLILSAAIFEEILFRGYPIERLAELTGRRWLAFAITIPLFVAPHIAFFGVQWLWTAGVGTLAIYALYAKTRNLPACMLLHLCLNLPILIPTIAHRIGG